VLKNFSVKNAQNNHVINNRVKNSFKTVLKILVLKSQKSVLKCKKNVVKNKRVSV